MALQYDLALQHFSKFLPVVLLMISKAYIQHTIKSDCLHKNQPLWSFQIGYNDKKTSHFSLPAILKSAQAVLGSTPPMAELTQSLLESCHLWRILMLRSPMLEFLDLRAHVWGMRESYAWSYSALLIVTHSDRARFALFIKARGYYSQNIDLLYKNKRVISVQTR